MMQLALFWDCNIFACWRPSWPESPMRHSMNNTNKAGRQGKRLRKAETVFLKTFLILLFRIPSSANDKTAVLYAPLRYCKAWKLRWHMFLEKRYALLVNSVERCTANVLPNSNAIIFFTRGSSQLSAETIDAVISVSFLSLSHRSMVAVRIYVTNSKSSRTRCPNEKYKKTDKSDCLSFSLKKKYLYLVRFL